MSGILTSGVASGTNAHELAQLIAHHVQAIQRGGMIHRLKL
jgi:hypothetical protein